MPDLGVFASVQVIDEEDGGIIIMVVDNGLNFVGHGFERFCSSHWDEGVGERVDHGSVEKYKPGIRHFILSAILQLKDLIVKI